MRAALVAFVLLAPALAGTGAQATDATPLARGLAFLVAHRDEVSPPLLLEAAAAAGIDPRAWPDGQRSPLDDVAAPSGASSKDYKATERAAYALAVSGLEASAFRGRDYLATIRAGFQGAQFGDPTSVNDDVWAILALRAAGVPMDDPQIQATVLTILGSRTPDHGWSYSTPALSSDPDITGMTLAALRAAGQDLRGDAAAGALEAHYDATSGGYASAAQPGTNIQSTLWALDGLAALGIAPHANTLTYVAAAQRGDGGFPSNSGSQTSDAWATAEAVTYLAGGRHPLPGYAPGSIVLHPAPAREASLVSVSGPFATARWTFDDADALGLVASVTFATKGEHAFRVMARGPAGAFLGEGIVHVTTARPIARVASPTVSALRHADVSIDASASRDPDGRIASWHIEWGDGNATDSASPRAVHAYDAPGERLARVYAVDDEGAQSDAVEVRVSVRDLPPTLAPLPARILADRAHDVVLHVAASDADGDAVSLHWSHATQAGEGDVRFRPVALGNATLRVWATDAYDARDEQDITVEVVDLPPTLSGLALPDDAVEGNVTASVVAEDPDGPAPRVTWRFDDAIAEGATVDVALGPGNHTVVVTATDADGLSTRAQTVLSLRARDAAAPVETETPPPSRAPAIQGVDASFVDGILRVRATAVPDDATLRVRWTSDAGSGDALLADGEAIVPLPNATRVDVVVEARIGESVATQAAGPFRAVVAQALGAPLPDLPERALVDARVSVALGRPPGATLARVDFGDGVVSAWTNATTLDHAWASPGAYVLRVEARAADGTTTSTSREIAIETMPRPQALEPASEPAIKLLPQESSQRPAPLPWTLLLVAALVASALRAPRRRARR